MTAITADIPADVASSGSNEPSQPLAGAGMLLRFVLRRDRRRLPVWIVGLSALSYVGSDAIMSLYPTQEDVQRYVDGVRGNPAVIMFAGPGYGFDDPNVGTVLVNEMSIWMAIACALMSIFLVVRHTRAEEDTGTADMVRAQPVGRHASITSVMVVAILANLVIGVASVIALIAVGYESTGSLALCGSFTLVGMLFAGIAAVAAQLGANARSSLGIASSVLGASFILRGIGDINESWLTWVSPLGWSIGVRAFADERWWTLGLLAVTTVVMVVIAYVLVDRRDLGSGLIADRAGSAEAPGWLANPTAMAWRQQRISIVAWAFGLFTMGLLFGSVSDAIEDMVDSNPELAEFITQTGGASITDSFLGSANSMIALLGAGFALSAMLRLRSNETDGFTEFVLTTPTGRPSLTAGSLTITVLASVFVMAMGGVGVALGNLLVLGNEGDFLPLVGAALSLTPALLVFAGFGLAMFGWLPRQSSFAWLLFAFVVTIGIFGDVLDLPDWATDWSPFAILPMMPAEDFEWAPTLGLIAVAAVLAGLGMFGFTRRDLEP